MARRDSGHRWRRLGAWCVETAQSVHRLLHAVRLRRDVRAWDAGLEFVALVKQRGTTPVHALQAGTINGAELLEWQDYVGSITKGKSAEIVAVSGDPLAAISETQRVKFVMKGGEIHRNDLTIGTMGAMLSR
jgi:hypothetical protein